MFLVILLFVLLLFLVFALVGSCFLSFLVSWLFISLVVWFVERYFRATAAALTVRQAQALQALMDLSDPDLLDLLLARREPEGELDLPDVRAVLNQMRAARALPLNS